MNGFDATVGIRNLEQEQFLVALRPPLPRRLSHQLNGRILIFAVSTSLVEQKRDELPGLGMDGWIPKPIIHKRFDVILQGITDPSQREHDVYHPWRSWEMGG